MQGRKMLVDIMVFYKNVNRYMEVNMDSESGLSMKDIFFLFFIASMKETTYYELSRGLPYDPSYVSKTIKKLEELELIKREKRGNKKIIRVGERGIEILQSSGERRSVFLDIMEKRGVSSEELTSFFNTMGKISRILEEGTAEKKAV